MTKPTGPRNAPERKPTFAGDVLKLVSGTTIAEALSILAAPLLTRLYAPETWGVLALFTSITGILGVIACMRYELAIMLPEKDDEAVNLLGVSMVFSILISLLTVPVIWWGKVPILRWLNAPGLAPYIWLVSVMVFINGVFLALNFWNSRTRHFSRLSIARVTNSFVATGGKITAGYVGYASTGAMISATVAGQAMATTLLGGQIWREDSKLLCKAIRWRQMREGVIRYKKFSLFSAGSALMNTLSTQLPPLLLAFFFSSTVVGFYAFGHRLLSMPMTLIGSAIAQVFFQRATEAKNQGTLHLVVKNTFIRLMALGSLPLLLIMIAGKDFFSVVFGSQWADAGVYAQILAPWILFVFLGSPISTLFNVLEIQGINLLFNSILLLTRFVSLIVGGLMDNVLFALLLYAGTGTVMWCGLCLYLLFQVGLTVRFFYRDVLKMAVITSLALIPVIVMKLYNIQSLYIVISGCLSAVIYYACLYFQEKQHKRFLGVM